MRISPNGPLRYFNGLLLTLFEMFSGEGRRGITKKNQGGNIRIAPLSPFRYFVLSQSSLKISMVCIIRLIRGPWSDF